MKIKFAQNGKSSFVNIICKKTQTLNQREAEVIMTSEDNEFLPFNVSFEKGIVNLCYKADGLLTLQNFLSQNALTHKIFMYILNQYISFERLIDDCRFSRRLVLYDLDYILINPISQKLFFMYIPIEPYETKTTLQQSLLAFSKTANLNGVADNIVLEFLRLVNSPVTFSLTNLEYFTEKFKKDDNSSNDIFCVKCGFKLTQKDTICPMCSYKVDKTNNSLLNKENEAYFRAQNIKASQDEKLSVKTIVKSAFLCSNDGIKTKLNKFPFIIGKQSSEVDLCIKNNLVSRKHATITKEDDKYFIVDIGATNGTYLNNERLKVNVKYKLNSNSVIQFANENYRFVVE